MGSKSRGNWAIGYCIKDCAARSKKNCAECVRFSKFKEVKMCECNTFGMKHKENELCRKQR